MAACCLLGMTAHAQFKLPKVKIPGKAPVALPGIDKLLKDEPVISTSLADTAPQISYLDDYDPQQFAPMAEVPRSLAGDFLRYPGLYEYDAESYCMHAGSYAPRRGNGYLYAPLKGKGAGPISKIIENSVHHPEVKQRDIQVLIWGILAKTKISAMPADVQNAAKTLLPKEDISKLNGGALGQIPPEVRSQVMSKLPPLARQAFEAETNLRNMLTGKVTPLYSDLERVAVFEGDPPNADEGEYVPSGRWSYHPNGFFIRMFPSSYSKTTVQIYDPEPIDVQQDALGRIQRITDPRGNVIEVTYADKPPLQVSGDEKLRGWAFAKVHFISPGEAAQPNLRREAVWQNQGWTFTGEAGGKGRVNGAAATFSGAGERYESVKKYLVQFQTMSDEFSKHRANTGAPGSPEHQLLGDVAHFRAALKALLAAHPQDEWVTPHADIVAHTWLSALYTTLEARPANSARARFQNVDYRLARTLQSFDEESFRNKRNGGGGGGGGGGGAGMPGPGRQRLAQSNRPKSKNSGNKNGPDAIDKARWATGRMGDANDAITLATGGPAGYAGGFIPGKMFGFILDFIYDTGRKITDALDMDPPRDDFQVYAKPEKITVEPLVAGEGLSPQRAQAWNDVMDASLDLLAQLRAAHISVDRHGGALRARNELWVHRQGAAIVHYKKQIGVSMIELAARLDKLTEVSRQEKIDVPANDVAAMRTYQERLRKSGFSPEELEAARLIGLTAAELEQMKTERLAADPQRVEGKNIDKTFRELAQSLRGLGAHLNALPPVKLQDGSVQEGGAGVLN